MSVNINIGDVPSRPLSLLTVETVYLSSGIENLGTNSSDSKGTLETINSDALSFSSLAPGETSPTMIVYLKVPTSLTINNIKLALTDCGGLTFGDTKFGVEVQPFVDYNIIPSDEFTGVNSTKDPNSPYNISVANKDSQSSSYVYLNMIIPRGQLFGSGTIRYKWWFDYN